MGAVGFTFILIVVFFAEPVSLENPFDPEAPDSPLGGEISGTTFVVDDGPGGSKLASLSWEAVTGAEEYEARINGDGSEVYRVTIA